MTKEHRYLLWLTPWILLSLCSPHVCSSQVDSEAGLTHDEQATLHFIAQRTVEYVVRGEDIPLFHVSSEGLKGHRGLLSPSQNKGSCGAVPDV